MAGRSSIDSLPTDIRERIDAAIRSGVTVDGLVELLTDAGYDISRSAAGRYSQKFARLAAQQRDVQSLAKAFGAEFGGGDDKQTRMMIQLMTTITTRALMPIASEDDPELGAKEIGQLARAVKDMASAAKTEAEREMRIRELERKRAADVAEKVGRAAGATDDTLARIHAAIMSMS